MSDAPSTAPTPEPTPGQAPRPTLEQRVNSFGREAEAMGERFAKDPGVQRAADSLARMWGLIILAAGLWFLADVTIGLDMPTVPWGDVWPLGLILIGLFVVVRGMGSRRA